MFNILRRNKHNDEKKELEETPRIDIESTDKLDVQEMKNVGPGIRMVKEERPAIKSAEPPPAEQPSEEESARHSCCLKVSSDGGSDIRLGSAPEPSSDIGPFDSEYYQQLECLANSGDIFARYWIGTMMDETQENFDLIEMVYRPAADEELDEAQYRMGLLYETWKYTDQGRSKAAEWYRKAAEQGNPRAQYRLGRLIDNGRVTGSKKDAARLYRQAANHTVVETKRGSDDTTLVARGALRNDLSPLDNLESSVINELRSAADDDDGEAQYELGERYFYGCGVPRDFESAVRWYRKASYSNMDMAQYKLAWLICRGIGTEQSYEEAAELFRQSAEQGNGWAQYELGRLYGEGKGVDQSYEDALKLYTESAHQKNSWG